MRAGDVRGQAMPVPSRPPLVGRDAEQAHLVGALGTGQHVLLVGPAGVGKTRLAEEALAAPALEHRALDRLLACAGTTGVALAAMLPLIAGRSAHDGLCSQIEWYLGRWRARRSAAGPTLVWLDDAHHLDDVSAALLRQAVSSGDVQLLGAFREHETLPDDLLALLVDGAVERVPVPPLDPAAARRLAALCSADETSPSQLERIAERAAGYPLFVRELAATPHTESLPVHGPGHAVLRARLAGLSPELRHTAELVALAQPLPAALLAHREQHVDALRHEGVLVHHGPHHLRLEHPLQAEFLVHELGGARADRYREMAARAAAEPGTVDPLLEVEWRLESGQRVDPGRAARAVRLALARTDTRAARRLLAHVDGERELLLGQTLAVEGDLDRALTLLEQVRREAADPEVRVEAAGFLARHLGLTRHDPAGAHDVLDRTDTPGLEVRLRRHLLLGRLWLRLFGPDRGPRITPSHDLLPGPGECDPVSYDLATAGAAHFCQTEGADAAAPLVERALAIERQVEVDEGAWCRARSVEAWWHVYAGDLVAARDAVADAVTLAWAQGWQEGFLLLAGNAALIGDLGGQPRPQLLPETWDHRTLHRDGPVDGDLYRLRALAEAAWKASCALADPAGECPCQGREPAGSGGAMPLLDAVVARAEDRVAPGRGTTAGTSLATALHGLADNDMRGWLAVLYLDGCDLGTPADEHRLVAARLGAEATGLHALARDAARARIEDEPARLLATGLDLTGRGFLLPATRVLADVARMQPAEETRLRAVQGLAAACAAWRGGPVPWLADVDGLPTARQLEIARAVTGGATVAGVADRWCLSRRTVENHVYRVARCLGAANRGQLGEILAHPAPGLARPAGSRPVMEVTQPGHRVPEQRSTRPATKEAR